MEPGAGRSNPAAEEQVYTEKDRDVPNE